MMPSAIAATPVRSIENVSLAPSRYGTVLGLAEQAVLADAHVVEEQHPGRRRVHAHLAQRLRSARGRACPCRARSCRILRSAGGLPSSSLQMKTIVSA